MKSIILAALGLVALVVAQNLADLPACATSCAASAIGATSCAITDEHCVCSNVAFLNEMQSCIATACDPADQLATLQFAKSYCASGGVTITLPSADSSNITSAASTSGSSSKTSTSATSTISTAEATSSGTAVSQASTSKSTSATSTSSGAAVPMASGASKWFVEAVGLGVAGIIAVL